MRRSWSARRLLVLAGAALGAGAGLARALGGRGRVPWPDPGERDRVREFDPDAQPMPVHSKLWRRPDPLIYAQGYLSALGLAVTWDNPDVHLERDGTAIPSWELEPGIRYDVVARVWNGSITAPIAGLPVRVSYLSFGIGTTSHPVGEAIVDLPVKGAPSLPAVARVPWTTPVEPGHYCLQVELLWADDANPANNLGQENTTVAFLNSPRADFEVPLVNAADATRTLRIAVDGYELPSRPPCPPGTRAQTPQPGRGEREARTRWAQTRHGHAQFELRAGWDVRVSPRSVRLGPGQAASIGVHVHAPQDFAGEQRLNVNAYDGPALVGGVTVIVKG